ncbi:hypothetical protein CPB84DRAFT_791150 [Gymnopilus junonius]|uniref:Uncharacterized protein n=1 Tax=Gymnopilus junonius TaxID=109634 RepID=A0A9P5NNN5_GYMJU|nr:hypothetical protein CPB84DRAFT_791150 [Gymnopilus junonius]
MSRSFKLSRFSATSSGGYGGTPEKVWSNRAQRGIDMPLGPDEISNQAGNSFNSDTSFIDQSTSGVDLEDKIQDAPQGRDLNYMTNAEEEEWELRRAQGRIMMAI